MSRLVNAFVELQSNGLATRGGLEAGRLLAICQRCPDYADCARRPADLAARLCDADSRCPGNWPRPGRCSQ